MKEILTAFAAYNKKVNEDLIAILEKLPEEKAPPEHGDILLIRIRDPSSYFFFRPCMAKTVPVVLHGN